MDKYPPSNHGIRRSIIVLTATPCHSTCTSPRPSCIVNAQPPFGTQTARSQHSTARAPQAPTNDIAASLHAGITFKIVLW